MKDAASLCFVAEIRSLLFEERCFSQRGKKHILKSDPDRDFSKVLIFYGHFHDIIKYRGVLFHVFVS